MITPERIEQLRSAAADAVQDRTGGATCLHVRADELLALCELAQEAGRLRGVNRPIDYSIDGWFERFHRAMVGDA